MQNMPLILFVFVFVFLISPGPLSSSSATTSSDLVRSSCIHARYPHLCLRTLSTFAGAANTPKDLAQVALNVSLSHARHLSRFLNKHFSSVDVHRISRNSALHDCADQIADSVDNLSRSLKELQHLRTATFQWQMSNAQTWVSAAMTDDDTCLDGLNLRDGDGDDDDDLVRKIKRKINRVARVTSNALYMINRLCLSRSRP